MTSYGCYDRAPYLDSYVLHGISRETGLPVQTKIEFRGTRECMYALHDQYSDPGCVGCSHKPIDAETISVVLALAG